MHEGRFSVHVVICTIVGTKSIESFHVEVVVRSKQPAAKQLQNGLGKLSRTSMRKETLGSPVFTELVSL